MLPAMAGNMIYRTLGSTGLEVSVIGVGTWQFGGEWGQSFTQDEVNAIFDAAREDGLNLIDTAECYGDHLSEEFIGRAIKHDREKWVLASKFGHHFHDLFTRTEEWKPDHILAQLDASLEALQTDYLDLWQFHSGSDEAFATDGMWEAAQAAVKAGKVRHLGISIGANTNAFQTGQAKTVGAEAIQVVYNRLDRKPEAEVLPICQRDDLGVLARVPLASGFLSGKYKPGDTFPENDVRERWMKQRREETLAEVARIREEEVPAGADMAAWALAWCLRDPVVTTVIPGCKSAQQVHSNASAVGLLDTFA